MNHADQDIKIYMGANEAEATIQSSGEQAAKEFVAHRENGNLAKTRELGELLAETLVGDASRLSQESHGHQKLVLVAYLLQDEAEDKLPNVILQKSVLSAMHRRLEVANPQLLEVITDSTAFTLYILGDRQRQGKSTGEILAQLCNQDRNQALIARGDQLEREYRSLFGGIITSYHFKEV